jgi:hypothetical protein
MTRRCLYALASVLLLANCSPITARNARKMIVGHSLADVKECLGVPTHEEDLSNGDHLAEWDYTKSSQLASLPLSSLAMLPLSLPMSLAGSVSINDNGTCKAILTIRSGKVVAMRYAGDSDSVSGRDSMCAPIVRGCVRTWKGQQ